MAKVSRFDAPSMAWVGADAPVLKWHFEVEVFPAEPWL